MYQEKALNLLGTLKCWCYECHQVPYNGEIYNLGAFRMICCPICGNKRCSRATFHDNECTNSNEPGQKGSRY
jgi:hypothetical protein